MTTYSRDYGRQPMQMHRMDAALNTRVERQVRWKWRWFCVALSTYPHLRSPIYKQCEYTEVIYGNKQAKCDNIQV